MKAVRVALQILLVLAVLGAAAGIAAWLMRSPTLPPASERAQTAPVVRSVVVAAPAAAPPLIVHGAVRAASLPLLTAEVSGTVTWIAPRLAAGLMVEAGEELVRLDERDARAVLASAQAEAAITAARLTQEQAAADQAIEEWRSLGQGAAASALAAREPQLAEAKARSSAAAAVVARAELDLDRCRIAAPAAALVLERQVEIGQAVARGAVLARLAGAAEVEIAIAMDDAELALLEETDASRVRGAQPLDEKSTSGAWPTISQGLGPRPASQVAVRLDARTWPARLDRYAGIRDPRTRSRQAIIVVPLPAGGPRLDLNAFVAVELPTRPACGVRADTRSGPGRWRPGVGDRSRPAPAPAAR